MLPRLHLDRGGTPISWQYDAHARLTRYSIGIINRNVWVLTSCSVFAFIDITTNTARERFREGVGGEFRDPIFNANSHSLDLASMVYAKLTFMHSTSHSARTALQ